MNIVGEATNTATVSLWSSSGAYATTSRKGNYFRGELAEMNTSAALWLSVTNLAVLSNGTNADIIASTTGFVFVAQSPETFGHDLDGNLTNDGRWAISWDAENRATAFTRISKAPSGSKVKLDCQYDHRWRRTQKIVSTWNGSAYVAQSTNKFVYDGWNLIVVLDATNGLLQSFTWGLDVSGTIQGAGGVGGLISMTVHQGTNAGTYFYCFDGNGNVVALVNAVSGAVAAQYEYSAFGEPLRASGALAFENPFTFSTKFCDWETGFLYYGYRYYDPITGLWLSRDPIEEAGGANLHGFVANDPLSRADFLGLDMFFVGMGDRLRREVDELIDSFIDKYIPRNDIGRPFARELMVHYAFGMKRKFERNDGNWGKFMKERPELQAAAHAKLQEIVRSLCAGSKDSGKINDTIVGVRLNELASMRMTLHGAHRVEIMDDFKVEGKGTTCCKVTFTNLRFVWIDVGDLHPGTGTQLNNGTVVDDSYFLRLARLIPTAGPYDISISWSADSQWMYDGKSASITYGWPSNVKPPNGGFRR